MDDIGWLLPVAGGLTGMVIGAAARLNRFCTLAALERHWYAGDSTGLRTWVLAARSEEHTSELQSLMRSSYAVFCLKKKNKEKKTTHNLDTTYHKNTEHN